MAYIRFNDSENVIKGSVLPMHHNVVRIITDTEPVLTGFRHFLDVDCVYPHDNGEYESYTTLYRQGDGWYELSNDGSVYEEVAPVQPEPYEPTLEEIIERKVSEMNAVQQKLIEQGVDVTLMDGTVEHFSLSANNQLSLTTLKTKVLEGIDPLPWHVDDETVHCKFYSNEDMKIITDTALDYVAYHVTYFRDLRIYIRTMETQEEVESVVYGIAIPEEYQSEPLKAMLAQTLGA